MQIAKEKRCTNGEEFRAIKKPQERDKSAREFLVGTNHKNACWRLRFRFGLTERGKGACVLHEDSRVKRNGNREKRMFTRGVDRMKFRGRCNAADETFAWPVFKKPSADCGPAR